MDEIYGDARGAIWVLLCAVCFLFFRVVLRVGMGKCCGLIIAAAFCRALTVRYTAASTRHIFRDRELRARG